MEIFFWATYFDGKSARARSVEVLYDGRRLRVKGEGVALEPYLEECRIVPPLGRTRRVVVLPDGGRLETDNQEAIRRLEREAGRNPGQRLVDALERRWPWVLASLVALLVFSWAFLHWGLPAAAQQAALLTPISVAETISEQALKLLDDQFLAPSRLSPGRRQELEALFQEVVGEMGGSYPYRLEFRAGPQLGPNALALPSGVVVLTDELVALAQDNREIEGVLAHEVAHILHRHSLRQLYQGAGLYVLVALALGDVASATSLAVGLPLLLIQYGYSRAYEFEADATAGAYLMRRYGTTAPLQAMLLRLESLSAKAHPPSYLSTHPATLERVERLQRLEQGGP
ncbi:Beta-barrel assembly-enhancing protease [Meiothermus luteus]|jgi:Zn-dependent protease with chaperone function|uniref:Beta-barrel assembly-enhancing protease n=1 Tax=Meiothermus luteus TaxID=2026184 RepID=A0A399EFP9_9DEIN|nr:M48 family metallopeptidase [Meiothermus luteus]RIH81979.1 Beta-barrel assembly-enhancing protease [Meiothermus luteus]RMH56694.1 MAG: hypothetical protein D6684_04955 [Deinococcota bacterium]